MSGYRGEGRVHASQTLELEDFRRATDLHRRRPTRLLVLGLALVTAASTLWLVVMGGHLGVALPLVVLAVLARLVLRRPDLATHFGANWEAHRRIEVELGPDEVCIRDGLGETTRAYATLRGWNETDAFVFLYLPTNDYHLLVKRALTAERLEAVRALLHDRVGAPRPFQQRFDAWAPLVFVCVLGILWATTVAELVTWMGPR